ncbi:uncharacterized protein TrAtP1_007671 [Trichoderma atroviride]|uniref:uncharacterized protein n=1 Tax=Hypocrea atroviridis TaxID=63577 RepID=UPI0033345AE3|nr:hypothetical protein TrAtP1_007671 [Trichoderma atroviride]
MASACSESNRRHSLHGRRHDRTRYLCAGLRSYGHVSSDYPRELASAGTAAGPPRSNSTRQQRWQGTWLASPVVSLAAKTKSRY